MARVAPVQPVAAQQSLIAGRPPWSVCTWHRQGWVRVWVCRQHCRGRRGGGAVHGGRAQALLTDCSRVPFLSSAYLCVAPLLGSVPVPAVLPSAWRPQKRVLAVAVEAARVLSTGRLAARHRCAVWQSACDGVIAREGMRSQQAGLGGLGVMNMWRARHRRLAVDGHVACAAPPCLAWPACGHGCACTRAGPPLLASGQHAIASAAGSGGVER